MTISIIYYRKNLMLNMWYDIIVIFFFWGIIVLTLNIDKFLFIHLFLCQLFIHLLLIRNVVVTLNIINMIYINIFEKRPKNINISTSFIDYQDLQHFSWSNFLNKTFKINFLNNNTKKFSKYKFQAWDNNIQDVITH